MPVQLKFIDLFAGLGGFHQALTRLGHECVFACEVDEVLNSLYKDNYGIEPHLDIRTVVPKDIEDHDILCAGFPCQSFSKAGRQAGFKCKTNGDLINYVLDIIDAKLPRFFILENVPNLEKHDEGKTLESILNRLKKNYDVTRHKMSPHEFGIAQVRERLFIVGVRGPEGSLGMFSFPEPNKIIPSIKRYLDKNPADAKKIPDNVIKCVDAWQEFITLCTDKYLPSFPIWAMEFGADYPLRGLPPMERALSEMRQFKGSFGESLEGCKNHEELEKMLPHYAYGADEFPDWKVQFIEQNRAFYLRHKEWIDKWLPKIRGFPHSLQKLEWNCKGEEKDIWQYVLQIRASGVRVKRCNTAPSLIAMTTTQVPIIGWEKRYMTPRECARLQSMEAGKALPETPTRAYKALGNAVNVKLVEMVVERLIRDCAEVAEECKLEVAV